MLGGSEGADVAGGAGAAAAGGGDVAAVSGGGAEAVFRSPAWAMSAPQRSAITVENVMRRNEHMGLQWANGGENVHMFWWLTWRAF